MENLNDFEYAKNKYSMTEEEIDLMYQQTRRLIFGNTLPEKKQPVAIITGGQPGSGKSGIVVKSKLDFAKENKEAIILDVDTYRGLYKNAALLAKEFPQFYSQITDVVVGKIMGKLVKETISNGYNYIFEGTMGNTEMIDSLEASDVNYKIVARIMAVSRFESLLSVFERYIEMNERMGLGRLTTIDAHDIRYNNYTKIASTLEGRNIEVEVYKRSQDSKIPTMIYKTSSDEKKYRSVMEAMNAGREESYRLCMKNATKRIESINQDIKKCAVDEKIVNELEKLKSIFDKEIEKYSGNLEK